MQRTGSSFLLFAFFGVVLLVGTAFGLGYTLGKKNATSELGQEQSIVERYRNFLDKVHSP